MKALLWILLLMALARPLRSLDIAELGKALESAAGLAVASQRVLLQEIGQALADGGRCNAFGGRDSCVQVDTAGTPFARICDLESSSVTDCAFRYEAFGAVSRNPLEGIDKEGYSSCSECATAVQEFWCGLALPSCGTFDHVVDELLPFVASVAAKDSSALAALQASVPRVFKAAGLGFPCRRMCEAITNTCRCGRSQTLGEVVAALEKSSKRVAFNMTISASSAKEIFRGIWHKPVCELFSEEDTPGFHGPCHHSMDSTKCDWCHGRSQPASIFYEQIVIQLSQMFYGMMENGLHPVLNIAAGPKGKGVLPENWAESLSQGASKASQARHAGVVLLLLLLLVLAVGAFLAAVKSHRHRQLKLNTRHGLKHLHELSIVIYTKQHHFSGLAARWQTSTVASHHRHLAESVEIQRYARVGHQMKLKMGLKLEQIVFLLILKALIFTATQAQQCSYKLEVKTLDATFAGTDATVDMFLLNANGNGYSFYDLDGPGDDFERDALNTFTRTAGCFSNFCRLDVHLGGDLVDVLGWGLQYVIVTATGPGVSKSVSRGDKVRPAYTNQRQCMAKLQIYLLIDIILIAFPRIPKKTLKRLWRVLSPERPKAAIVAVQAVTFLAARIVQELLVPQCLVREMQPWMRVASNISLFVGRSMARMHTISLVKCKQQADSRLAISDAVLGLKTIMETCPMMAHGCSDARSSSHAPQGACGKHSDCARVGPPKDRLQIVLQESILRKPYSRRTSQAANVGGFHVKG
ncbi:hypothetical protein SELMODRAFT_443631 [Selaginella moellendorffii]|uniref:Uncharacterized protein n=1 Tax=Selaginella moellendorffii TaxID=88036 RepID=D8S334_SELML|nr:hypothetical protein SELMODRAFT_443631 [Selaginella moellendorffii]